MASLIAPLLLLLLGAVVCAHVEAASAKSKGLLAIEVYDWLRQAVDDCINFQGDWALTDNYWALVDEGMFRVKDGKHPHPHSACNYTITVCTKNPASGKCRPGRNQLDLPVWGRYNTDGFGSGVPALVTPNVGLGPTPWKRLYKDHPIEVVKQLWVVRPPHHQPVMAPPLV